ncbi:XdhC family protein [Herbiconiux sp. CPCC 203407]|uniref:XdhC family protein n=1 Tax=Herbiconiux oxytropis TaxID=2970915 RepID=A0AA42BVQ8_9MICO|nr:XdhC/CoxI family protein [Herbiconiux oxytropis]MCS5722471.1 XdhC family protein [Herbiconiux oxytropis]MCS5727596.1 XdhC family protein [Herbiconiux oxytropis]
MLELAAALLESLATGRRLAVATVVAVDGSAPRALGTSMAVDDAGRVIGSISGGCVEGAVYEACGRVLDTGEAEICAFGFSDADAFAVGLSCGGRITVAVHELAPAGMRNEASTALLGELALAREGRAAGVALVLPQASEDVDEQGRRPADGLRLMVAHDTWEGDAGALGPAVLVPAVPAALQAALLGALHRGRTERREIECDGVVVEAVLVVAAAPPRMIVFGAVDFSVALSNAAALLGYRVTVCDARPVFATADRFPHAEVVNRWPTDYLAETEVDERTVVCILTHDDKFDVPLIEAALALPVAYVGAMGSRVTHDRRVAALRSRGLDDEALASLHSPIGLDLGGSTPEETAVSILAEVIAARNGASGASLRVASGPIHRVDAVPVDRVVDRAPVVGEAP